jgi:hypothetical protein
LTLAVCHQLSTIGVALAKRPGLASWKCNPVQAEAGTTHGQSMAARNREEKDAAV